MSWNAMTLTGCCGRCVYELFEGYFLTESPIWEASPPLILNFAFDFPPQCRGGIKQKSMVLQSFSWQDFMLAAAALLVLWYVGLAVLFRKRSRGAGLGSSGSTAPLPHGWQDQVDELSDSAELMGKSVPDHGVSIVEAEEFSFSERYEVSDQGEQLGLIPDLQQEIKSVCALLAEQDGKKEHFFSLFSLVRDKYPKVSSAAARTGLNLFIREHVPFNLSDEELEDLWS